MAFQRQDDPQTYDIIGAAMRVHKALGNGFLEAVYQEALCIEFEASGIPFQREVSFDIRYRGRILACSYKADFVCFESVIVELKAIRKLTNTEDAQVLNYLNATGLKRGLLFNFASSCLEHKRLIN